MHVYRLEQGEFVVLAPLDDQMTAEDIRARALHALGSEPDSRPVSCGTVVIPDEAQPATAMAMAEARLAPSAPSPGAGAGVGTGAPALPASEARDLGGVVS